MLEIEMRLGRGRGGVIGATPRFVFYAARGVGGVSGVGSGHRD